MILFARLKMQYLLENYFGDHPDIWVFGTTAGYRNFVGHLERRAVGCDEDTSLPATNPVGMDVLVMPTCREASKPFLVVQERLVFQRKRFNMQLIIGGCTKGFRYLAEQFQSALAFAGDPSNHVHIDDGDRIVALPCVHLNIRGPVSRWDRKSLPDYWHLCSDPKSLNRLPDGIPLAREDGKVWAPVPLDYRTLHCRLPMKREKRSVA